ncbi:MAG: leucine zipper domain-containing protein [Methanosarcina sp.]
MKLHANAHTCPKSRCLLVDRLEGDCSLIPAAEAAGISERTAAKWLARRRRGGPCRPKLRPYGAVYGISAEHTSMLPGWLTHYNFTRRHGSLGHKAPGARLAELEQRPE